MIVYSNKYKNSQFPFDSYEFEVLNELADTSCRTDANCIQHTRFLFEMDSTPLDEQFKYYKSNKEYITRCVFSGSKSLHIIIQLPDSWEDTCKENYKEVWTIINTILFDNLCDRACANPSRLTRRPNALRQDSHKVQHLIYDSRDTRLSEDILNRIAISLRSRIRQKHLFNCIRSNICLRHKDNSGICKNYDVIQHYLNTSYPKLQGNGDSSISLFKAIRCCLKYCDRETLKEIISKAFREHWSNKEIERMINNIKTKYL